MRFLNREHEMERLDGLVERGGGFGAIYGRRRIGKTRLLVEWVRRHGGVYTVADQSAAEVQRRYLAEAIATRLEGFADVQYRDWRSLLSRLARDAAAAGWRGPFVLDELPYLVVASPELPAILQRWIDHEASELVVVVAGSSQHMMQGLVLDGNAPLFGRAREIMEIEPLAPRLLPDALGLDPMEAVEAFTAWGGVPRYWELASEARGPLSRRIDRLVLDPLGALHREPDRLIVEELPPATEARALLDAIDSGAHKVSEIAGRIGRPATSLNRPLQRLQGMGLVRREVPFGDNERSSKRLFLRWRPIAELDISLQSDDRRQPGHRQPPHQSDLRSSDLPLSLPSARRANLLRGRGGYGQRCIVGWLLLQSRDLRLGWRSRRSRQHDSRGLGRDVCVW